MPWMRTKNPSDLAALTARADGLEAVFNEWLKLYRASEAPGVPAVLLESDEWKAWQQICDVRYVNDVEQMLRSHEDVVLTAIFGEHVGQALNLLRQASDSDRPSGLGSGPVHAQRDAGADVEAAHAPSGVTHGDPCGCPVKRPHVADEHLGRLGADVDLFARPVQDAGHLTSPSSGDACRYCGKAGCADPDPTEENPAGAAEGAAPATHGEHLHWEVRVRELVRAELAQLVGEVRGPSESLIAAIARLESIHTQEAPTDGNR